MFVRCLVSLLLLACILVGGARLDAPLATIASISAPSGAAVILGDVDCDQDVDSVDALQGLRDLSGLPASADCIEDAGDTDCDGDHDSVDSLRILKYAAAFANATPPGCPPIGTPVGGALLLNEVLFAAGDDDPFVELKAAGGTADPSGLTLVNERNDQFAVPNFGQLTDGAVLLLGFGGSDFIAPDSGFIELRDGDDLLDRVAWGDDFADAVNLSRGVMSALPPDGASIGRPPGADVPADRLQWAVYYEGATPGLPNPNVEIAALSPRDGARFPTNDAYLSWLPVVGASSYAVSVAPADGPASFVFDETVDRPGVDLGTLAAGEYTWTVQPIGASGSAAPPSEPHTFTVADPVFGVSPSSVPGAEAVLDVEFMSARKDTSMLLLEADEIFVGLNGDHFWDAPHGGNDLADPADHLNMIEASVVMVNAYLGGNLSQDRLGYEVFRDRAPGPERDLSYGDAPTLGRTQAMVGFAFGGFTQLCSDDVDEQFQFIKGAIDNDLPLIAYSGGNAFPDPNDPPIIVGFGQVKVEVINAYLLTDPGLGADPVPFVGVYDSTLVKPYATELRKFDCFWKPPDSAFGFTEEASVTTDSDGDNVVDFDEIMRFQTDPDDIDTDGDGISDKEDIRESVYGPLANGSPTKIGRDWDNDSVPAERDCDNDADGIIDGQDDDFFSNPDVPDTSLCGPLLRFTSPLPGVITDHDSQPCVLFPQGMCTAYNVTFSVAWSGLDKPATVECSASGGRDEQVYPATAPFGSRDFELNFGSWQFEFLPFITCTLLDDEGGLLDLTNAQIQL